MKKYLLILLLTLLLSLTGAGCAMQAADPIPEDPPAETPETPAEAGPTDQYELAFISDVATVDDASYNDSLIKGMVKYAEENDLSYFIYLPEEATDAAYLEAINLAAANGAKFVLTAGALFSDALYQAQYLHPEICFLAVDASPKSTATNESACEKNVYCVYYAEEEAGFLAGYAAVKEGYTKLGFIGGLAVPSVVRYGIGFIQGASAAADEMAVEVEMLYNYSGLFVEDPTVQTRAGSWYINGTELIFACGGGITISVAAAAESAGAKVIGVDADQYFLSQTIITSAIKELEKTAYDAITMYYDGNFPGGQEITLSAAQGYAGLAMSHSQLANFSQADYYETLSKIKDGRFTVKNDISLAPETYAGANLTVIIE